VRRGEGGVRDGRAEEAAERAWAGLKTRERMEERRAARPIPVSRAPAHLLAVATRRPTPSTPVGASDARVDDVEGAKPRRGEKEADGGVGGGRAAADAPATARAVRGMGRAGVRDAPPRAVCLVCGGRPRCV